MLIGKPPWPPKPGGNGKPGLSRLRLPLRRRPRRGGLALPSPYFCRAATLRPKASFFTFAGEPDEDRLLFFLRRLPLEDLRLEALRDRPAPSIVGAMGQELRLPWIHAITPSTT
jgi:hypothetical protein